MTALAKQITNLIIAKDLYDEVVGLRGLYRDEIGKVGKKLKKSRMWIDHTPTSKKLNGVCCIGIGEAFYMTDDDWEDKINEALENVIGYGDSGKIGLIIGTKAEAGEDGEEYIIENGKLIAVF